MCGISGFFDYKGRLSQLDLDKYTEIMYHRGPDGNGTYFEKTTNGNIGLAHVRLSILDLSNLGKQPMEYEHLKIVFNGEIYNFKSIQKELIELGYKFISNSDTEVILKSFLAWGQSCVNRFSGMFAFTIYDRKKQQILICRDRAGVKPIYWYKDNDQFIFGSELKVFFNSKTFHPEVDKNSLKTFMNYGYVTNEKTMLKDVFKAEAGAWTIFDIESNKMEVQPFWSFAHLFEKEKFKGDFIEATEETERLAKIACELRMVSDVPVGVFLSGGFDSALVTTLLQKDRTEKLKTFTIGFSDGVDESKDAANIANFLGTDHTSYDCQMKDAMELIPLLPLIFDDPIADVSCIPTMLVSKLAKNEVTVALSGDGGDELFGGYDGFKISPNIIRKVNRIPFKKMSGLIAETSSSLFSGNSNHLHKKLKGLKSMLLSPENERVYQMYIHNHGLPEEILSNLFLDLSFSAPPNHSKVNLIDPLDDLYILGFEDTLRNLLLTKVDRATMCYSLEGREPFLDHYLMSFSASLPYDYKNNGIESKRPIKEIVNKYIPSELMNRPKTGFDLPLNKWLLGELSFLIEEYLNKNEIEFGGFFNSKYVEDLVKMFRNNQLRYSSLIWRLLIFQMWYSNWFLNKKD
jgi:asparagine synthase (glutamine-hydrolysing)